ncbi:ArsR/SmtB family transcription factor [Kiloniella antarctica]|uniref:ArsR/SmtB family transcription factor n=1 Tax=Kiloniella antarctica TaxID=1550907 RepID=UPI0036D40AF6
MGSLIGDPARANMLSALISGKALTPSELAEIANITLQTTSAHLKKMEAGGLIRQRKQGRHRYFNLADEDVAGLIESMMGLAAKKGHIRTRTGPKAPELRKARVCYNHLAGELGVQMYDSLISRKYLHENEDEVTLTKAGKDFISTLGIEIDTLKSSRRPLCKSCLDWSARRSHLAGSLGTALLDHIYAKGWARRLNEVRVVEFSPKGELEFTAHFPL